MEAINHSRITYLGVSETGVFVRVQVQEVTLIQGKLSTRVQV